MNIELTERQIVVLRTMCEIIDVDVLNVNLEHQGDSETDLDELDKILVVLL